MKLDELLHEINKYNFLYAQADSKLWPGDIVISIKSVNQYLPLIVLSKDELNANDYDFHTENLHNNIGPLTLRNVLDTVTAYIHTPIEERFPEKKWLLCLGKSDYGQEIYLTKTDDPRKIGTTMNADCFTEWNDQELQDLVGQFPNLAPVIDDMMEEVGSNDNRRIN